MKRLMFSDIHIGSQFLLVVWLNRVIQLILSLDYDELILIGDIWDFWLNPNNPLAIYLSPDSQRFIRAVLYARDNGKKVVYVKGNHDSDIQQLGYFGYFGYRDRYEFSVGAKTFTVEHGHQYDPYNKGRAFIGRVATAFSGLLGLFGINAPARLDQWSFAQNADKRMVAEERARIVAKWQGKTDVFINGHTHNQVLQIYPGKRPLIHFDIGDIIDHGTYGIIEDGVPMQKRL